MTPDCRRRRALSAIVNADRFDLGFYAGCIYGLCAASFVLAVLLVDNIAVQAQLCTSGYTENAIVHHGRLDSGVLLLANPYRKSDLARMMRMALDN